MGHQGGAIASGACWLNGSGAPFHTPPMCHAVWRARVCLCVCVCGRAGSVADADAGVHVTRGSGGRWARQPAVVIVLNAACQVVRCASPRCGPEKRCLLVQVQQRAQSCRGGGQAHGLPQRRVRLRGDAGVGRVRRRQLRGGSAASHSTITVVVQPKCSPHHAPTHAHASASGTTTSPVALPHIPPAHDPSGHVRAISNAQLNSRCVLPSSSTNLVRAL